MKSSRDQVFFATKIRFERHSRGKKAEEKKEKKVNGKNTEESIWELENHNSIFNP